MAKLNLKTLTIPAALAALIALLLSACHSPTGTGDGDVEDLSGDTFRMMPFTYRDPMINNMPAFTMLVPKGWQVDGGLVWRHNMAIHAATDMTIHNPGSGDLLQIYPIVSFTYIPNPVVPIANGTVYLGSIFLPPIEDLGVFLNELVFKTARSNAQNASVTSSEPLTAVAQAIWRESYGSSPETGVRALRWNVTYTMGGVEYDESFFVAVSYTTSAAMPGTVIWQPEYVYSIRSRKGNLPKAEGLLQAVAASITMDMKWFALYMQVHQMWIDGQMQAIRDAGELSRYISQVNADINATIVDGYNQRQASQDRIYDEFSESIRGVETYSNPNTGRNVQLPNDFSNAWVSSGGEYFLTNGTDDPNVGSLQTWTRLTVAP